MLQTAGGADPAAGAGEARGERERQPDEVREWSECGLEFGRDERCRPRHIYARRCDGS